MRVSDIMSAPVYTIEANETAAAAWETMFFCRTRHLVVTDAEGRVVGVVSASDLGGKNGESLRARRRVRDLMTEKVVTTTPETTVREGHVLTGRVKTAVQRALPGSEVLIHLEDHD